MRVLKIAIFVCKELYLCSVSRLEKILSAILSGSSDTNINFGDLQNTLDSLGFDHRIRGSHHIYYKDGIDEIINIQPNGSKAKPYQVKQVRNIILKYKLTK